MTVIVNRRFDTEPLSEYFKNGGNTCLYCMSENIRSAAPRIENGEISVDVICNDCKQGWVEIYTLAGVYPKGE